MALSTNCDNISHIVWALSVRRGGRVRGNSHDSLPQTDLNRHPWSREPQLTDIRPQIYLCNSIDNNFQILLLRTMLRGLITEQPGFPASRQKETLEQLNVTRIYDSLTDLLKSMRKRDGDLVAVADFRGLGRTKAEMVANLDRIHDAGFAAVDVTHDWRSDGRNAVKALAYADTARINSKRGPDGDEAQRFGRKGGLANGRRRRKERMPKAMALVYWRDVALKNAEAIEKMNSDPNYPGEWNESLAYRHLKKRGGIPGRRANPN